MSEFSAGLEDPLKVTIEDLKPLLACRGCLATEDPLRPIDNQLADAFSKYIYTVEKHDIYSKYICMYCRTMLLKFVAFREKCLMIQSDFNKLSSMGFPITLDLIKVNGTSSPFITTPLSIISLGDNKHFGVFGESGTSSTVEQNEPKNPVTKEEDTEVEIIPSTLDDDEMISLSDDDYDDASDSSEDTDVPDCLRGFNSAIYQKDTKKKVKPQNTDQQIDIMTSVSNRDKSSDADMIVDETENVHDPTLSKTTVPQDKMPQNDLSPGKVGKHRDPRASISGFSVKQTKAWIDKIKSERIKKSKDERPPETENGYNEQNQEVFNDDVDVKHFGRNSTSNDRKNLNQLRNWISTVKASRTNQVTKKRKRVKEKILKEKPDFAKEFDVKIVEIPKDKQMQHIIERKDTDKYKKSKYKCTLCITGFNTNVTYENYMVMHKPLEGHVMCDVCKKYYPSKRLNKHVSDSHKHDYICNICGQVCHHRFQAKGHYQWHKGIKYTCKICGKLFNKQNSVQGHMHLSHKHLMVKCSICNRQYIGDRGLHCHMKYAHREAIGAVCASCSLQFHSMNALMKHQSQGVPCDKTHRPCAACGTTFTSDSILEDHKCEFIKSYNCEHCHMCFRDIGSYLRHVHSKQEKRIRNTTRSFVCDTCGTIFYSTYLLDVHRRKKHTGETNLICDYCGKGYFIKHQLKNHVIYKHMGKQFARKNIVLRCKYCDKEFSHESNKYRHEKTIHEDRRAHKCDICGAAFSVKAYVQDHIRHIHGGVPWPKRVRNRHK